jgi:phosphatidylserine decarboxylase
MKFLFRLLTQLSSRRTLSHLAGLLAKTRWSKRLIPLFVKAYGICVDEAEWPPDAYPHLNAFFTRRLKQGARPIHPGEHIVVSPVDATITGMGVIGQNALIQVKGKSYSLAEMLQDASQTKRYERGHFLVLYLSPKNYHRIHAPISGRIVHTMKINGTVYPVNPMGLRLIDSVLTRNERVITYIEHEGTKVAVVKVGAMNVASIKWSDLLNSSWVTKGDELAFFEFGSTVVLLFERNTFCFDQELKEGVEVKMGQRIGFLFPCGMTNRCDMANMGEHLFRHTDRPNGS